MLNTFSKGLARCSGSNWVFFPDPNWLCAPGANSITPCYRITLENGSYGVETYINADSKIQITFEDGNTLIGYIECVEYGTYSDENDTLVIRGENGELYILLENRIKDIEELHE